MRNRQKQRTLRRAGVRREDMLEPQNAEHYADPTPREAVKKIIRGKKERRSCT